MIVNHPGSIASAAIPLRIGARLSGRAGPAGVPVVEKRAGVLLSIAIINTTELPSSLRLICVLATPYDNNSPAGPTGPPQHVEIDIALPDPPTVQTGAPILNITSVVDYERLRADSGDPDLSRVIQQVHALLAHRLVPIPTVGMPVLPFERVDGTSDLAFQRRCLPNPAYLVHKAEQLDALAPANWYPELAVLGTIVDSLWFKINCPASREQEDTRRLGDSGADASPKSGTSDRGATAEFEKGDVLLHV